VASEFFTSVDFLAGALSDSEVETDGLGVLAALASGFLAEVFADFARLPVFEAVLALAGTLEAAATVDPSAGKELIVLCVDFFFAVIALSLRGQISMFANNYGTTSAASVA